MGLKKSQDQALKRPSVEESFHIFTRTEKTKTIINLLLWQYNLLSIMIIFFKFHISIALLVIRLDQSTVAAGGSSSRRKRRHDKDNQQRRYRARGLVDEVEIATSDEPITLLKHNMGGGMGGNMGGGMNSMGSVPTIKIPIGPPAPSGGMQRNSKSK